MGDSLVKLHTNKMDSEIRKIKTDKLPTQAPSPPAYCPLIVLGFSLSWEREGIGTELLSSSPKICPQ